MLPWQECPHVTVPLDGSYADVAIGDSLLAAAQRLLGKIKKEIPFYARPLAYAVHARTKCLFFREARGRAPRGRRLARHHAGEFDVRCRSRALWLFDDRPCHARRSPVGAQYGLVARRSA